MLVTGEEIPFKQDGTRDGEHIRRDMRNWLIDGLGELGHEYIILRGSKEERVRTAVAAIDRMLT